MISQELIKNNFKLIDNQVFSHDGSKTDTSFSLEDARATKIQYLGRILAQDTLQKCGINSK